MNLLLVVITLPRALGGYIHFTKKLNVHASHAMATVACAN